MGHDEVEVFIYQAVFGGISAGDGALVEGMPGGDSGHDGRARHAGHVNQFVHNAGVGGEGAAAGNTLGKVVGDAAAQIAGVVAHGMLDFGEHHVVDFIHAAFNGLEQAAAGHDGVELKRNTVAFEHFEHEVAAIFKLVGHQQEWFKVFNRMFDVLDKHRGGVVKNRYFG